MRRCAGRRVSFRAVDDGHGRGPVMTTSNGVRRCALARTWRPRPARQGRPSTAGSAGTAMKLLAARPTPATAVDDVSQHPFLRDRAVDQRDGAAHVCSADCCRPRRPSRSTSDWRKGFEVGVVAVDPRPLLDDRPRSSRRAAGLPRRPMRWAGGMTRAEIVARFQRLLASSSVAPTNSVFRAGQPCHLQPGGDLGPAGLRQGHRSQPHRRRPRPATTSVPRMPAGWTFRPRC